MAFRGAIDQANDLLNLLARTHLVFIVFLRDGEGSRGADVSGSLNILDLGPDRSWGLGKTPWRVEEARHVGSRGLGWTAVERSLYSISFGRFGS